MLHNTNKKEFNWVRSEALTAIISESGNRINIPILLTLSSFISSLIDVHCSEGFSRLLCHVLLACFR